MPRRLAILALVVVVCAGCSGSKGSTSHKTTTTLSGAASMEGLLISNVPAGFAKEPDAKADTGPTDFEKAVKSENSPDGRDLLTRAKFKRGYQRVWSNAALAAQTVDYLYQFADADSAKLYLQARVAKAMDTTPVNGQPRPTPTPFDLPDVPGATGVTMTSGSFFSAVVLLARGPYVAQIVVDSAQGVDGRDAARSLAKQQYDKLPA